ncbi:MAG: 1-phosphofructokinase family hexose kinase [Flavobacterium sp.]|nr:1-phosphofructokinase family hexose kinase [Flavobacterium sp.]
MHDIVTLTVNPALDKSTSCNGLIADAKIRCEAPTFEAGGGGINVSKAISRLEADSLCVFTSGGSAGELVEKLLQKEKIKTDTITVSNWTRENLVVQDTNTQQQFRFGFPGGSLTIEEVTAVLDKIKKHKCRYLVASGSLNDGLSSDFYQQIAAIAKENDSKLIIDTSGEALKQVLETGVYLVKPNIGELAKLIGENRLEADDAEDAARTLIDKGNAEIVVVSLGPQGALLVSKDQRHYISAPNVAKRSTVGAGDSMVGGMVWALSQNKSLKEVIQWGVACGSAATISEGTQLFTLGDAQRLFRWLNK